jgi:hypothetical protein
MLPLKILGNVKKNLFFEGKTSPLAMRNEKFTLPQYDERISNTSSLKMMQNA